VKRNTMTSRQLLKARDEGAAIRVCRVGGSPVNYLPRYSGDRSPWLVQGSWYERCTAAQCIAINPATGGQWSDRAPAA
jgi:hypothetical protein